MLDRFHVDFWPQCNMCPNRLAVTVEHWNEWNRRALPSMCDRSVWYRVCLSWESLRKNKTQFNYNSIFIEVNLTQLTFRFRISDHTEREWERIAGHNFHFGIWSRQKQWTFASLDRRTNYMNVSVRFNFSECICCTARVCAGQFLRCFGQNQCVDAMIVNIFHFVIHHKWLLLMKPLHFDWPVNNFRLQRNGTCFDTWKLMLLWIRERKNKQLKVNIPPAVTKWSPSAFWNWGLLGSRWK